MDKQNVTHFKQRFNWDCGISCILMILPEHDRHHFLNNFDSICKAENIEKTTWTIDLCYLLKRFNIQHNYFTKTLGIHSEYKEQSYYEKILQKVYILLINIHI